jgi:multiple sugar transport system ATP-binding protein
MELPIILSEYVGAQSVLISDVGGQSIQIEISTPTPIPAGTKRSFVVNAEEIHLFDPQLCKQRTTGPNRVQFILGG